MYDDASSESNWSLFEYIWIIFNALVFSLLMKCVIYLFIFQNTFDNFVYIFQIWLFGGKKHAPPPPNQHPTKPAENCVFECEEVFGWK